VAGGARHDRQTTRTSSRESKVETLITCPPEWLEFPPFFPLLYVALPVTLSRVCDVQHPQSSHSPHLALIYRLPSTSIDTMNDPGLHSPIEDGAKAVEENRNLERKEQEIQEEDEQTFLKPRFCSSFAYITTTNLLQSVVVCFHCLSPTICMCTVSDVSTTLLTYWKGCFWAYG